MQMECPFQQFSVQYVFVFWNKNFWVWNGVISKSHDSQIVPKCDFEKGGTTIEVSILHVLLNILSISSLPMVHDTSVIFEMQKE